MGVVAGDSVTSADHTRHGPATRLSGRVPTTPVAQRPKPLLLRERAACRTGHRMCRRDQDRFTPSTYRFEPVMKPLCPEARKVTAAAQSSWRPSVTCAARCTPGPVTCSRSGASPDRPGGVGLAQPDGVDPDAAPLEFTGPGTGERTGGGRGRRVHAERLRADVTPARVRTPGPTHVPRSPYVSSSGSTGRARSDRVLPGFLWFGVGRRHRLSGFESGAICELQPDDPCNDHCQPERPGESQ